MNIFKLRENKAKLAAGAMVEILNGFEHALIWQDEQLDNVYGLPLTHEAQAKCTQTVMIFLSVVYTSNKATRQLIEHGLSQTGHDLALQMLGHGVGFWEQENTSALDEILDYLLDMKSILPFKLYYSEASKNLDWDTV